MGGRKDSAGINKNIVLAWRREKRETSFSERDEKCKVGKNFEREKRKRTRVDQIWLRKAFPEAIVVGLRVRKVSSMDISAGGGLWEKKVVFVLQNI